MHPDGSAGGEYGSRCTALYVPDGFEILAEMRSSEAFRSTPVLILTAGDVTDEVSTRAAQLGAVGVEPSPVAADRLVARVSEFVKPAPRVATSTARETQREEAGVSTSRRGSLPKAGYLREIPLPELLHSLHSERMTGVLLLDHGKKKKAV